MLTLVVCGVDIVGRTAIISTVYIVCSTREGIKIIGVDVLLVNMLQIRYVMIRQHCSHFIS
jgi:hypothetical protein